MSVNESKSKPNAFAKRTNNAFESERESEPSSILNWVLESEAEFDFFLYLQKLTRCNHRQSDEALLIASCACAAFHGILPMGRVEFSEIKSMNIVTMTKALNLSGYFLN